MIESYLKAGKIVSDIRSEASKMIKDGTLVIDLVNYVESEILKSGAEIAFPCNVSLNEIAAHYTSPANDKLTIKAGDMVKLDLGAMVDGYIAAGLEAAIATARAGVEVSKIGAAVHEAISEYNLNPIFNLTGHSLEQYNLHAGISIPNYDNHDGYILEEGQAIAIEPFATNGEGIVNDAPGHYIFSYMANKPFRMKSTQRVLKYIQQNHKYVPFSGRWITDEFGERKGAIALKQLSGAMAVYPYAPLREKEGCFVSQKEHTIIVEKEGCTVTTI